LNIGGHFGNPADRWLERGCLRGCGTFARVEVRQVNLPCVPPLPIGSANNLNLLLEQHSQRRTLRVSFGVAVGIGESPLRQQRAPEDPDSHSPSGALTILKRPARSFNPSRTPQPIRR